MRNVGRIKLGYYPLPTAEGIRLRNLLQYPAEAASVIDPCVGTGTALMQLTTGENVALYGVELDADRTLEATAMGIETLHGNLFDVEAKVGRFSVLYLNPPYDSEVGSIDNKRMEYVFLEHTYRWLVYGGVLLMVVPHKQLDSCASLLAANFTSFRVFRLTDPESERFDQVVLVGIRKKMAGEAYQRNRELLVKAIWTNPFPTLTGQEAPYGVPAVRPTGLSYRGACHSVSSKTSLFALPPGRKLKPSLIPKEEMTGGRPITPLHGGHVGLLCTAGLLNGVFGRDKDRHIARWRTVKSVTTFEVEEDGFKEVHKRERFSNELALIYEDGRTQVLTEEKKGGRMQNAHLRLGRLEYIRNTEKTKTRIFLHVDRYIGEDRQAHLVSLFGNDAEVGAITAAIHENHTFDLTFPDGKTQVAGFGKDVSCYRGSLHLPDRKQSLRHLIAVSTTLHGNGSAGQTFIMNYQRDTRDLTWATLVSLLGMPADPRWETISSGSCSASGRSSRYPASGAIQS